MRKTALVISLFLTFFLLSACTEKEIEITADSEITMENLDDYLYRDDVQYVDLRNHEDYFKYGYIDGFDNIPFFDYLDYRAFDRSRTYEFSPDQLKDTSILERLFERDKAILLYADGCIRSGYLKDVLNYLGYERVFVIGGFYEYLGQNKVYGDGNYEIGNVFYRDYMDEEDEVVYIMMGEYDVAKNIESIRFNILDFDGECVRHCDINYPDEMLTIIENHITNNIYNFNEIVELLDDPNSDISTLDGVDWNVIPQIEILFSYEYRD